MTKTRRRSDAARVRKIPLTRYPNGAERDYYKSLIRAYTAWYNDLIDSLNNLPNLSGLKRARLDADTDSLFDQARQRWGQEAESLKPEIQRMANAVNRTAFLSITEQKRAAGKSMGIDLGVGAIPFDPDIQGEIDASLRENVRLIKSLGNQSLDKIETLVTDTVRQGTLTKELRNQLIEDYGITKRRAALIATDQVGKLNGNINRLRQKKAGVKRYKWSSMQDRRVRPEHAKRNGQIYSWDSPPSDGHPGQPIRCRCTASPIFDDAEDFGLTPEEIAEDLAEQGLIEARQKAAIEARLRTSAQAKAEKTQANRAKGAKKAAKTRAKNIKTKEPRALVSGGSGSQPPELPKPTPSQQEPKRPRLSQTWDNPPAHKVELKSDILKAQASENKHDKKVGQLAERYFDRVNKINRIEYPDGLNHSPIGEVDIDLDIALIEVTTGNAKEKKDQYYRYANQKINPFGLPVILFCTQKIGKDRRKNLADLELYSLNNPPLYFVIDKGLELELDTLIEMLEEL